MNDPNAPSPPVCSGCRDEMNWSDSNEKHFCDDPECDEYDAGSHVANLVSEFAALDKKNIELTVKYNKVNERLLAIEKLAGELMLVADEFCEHHCCETNCPDNCAYGNIESTLSKLRTLLDGDV